MKRLAKLDYVIPAFLVLFLLVLIIFTYKDHGLTFDELDQIKYGQGAWGYYFSLFKNKDFFKLFPRFFYPTHGILPVIIPEVFVRVSNISKIEDYHFWNAVLAIPSYLFVYLLAKNISGSRLTGLFSFFSLLVFPRFTGDVFNNSKDIPLGMYLSVAIYLLFLWVRSKNKNTNILIILSVLTGILISIKIIMVYFAFFVLMRINYKYKKIDDKKKYIFIFVVLTYISYIFFSPQLHNNPFFGLFESIKDTLKYQDVGQTLFSGHIYISDHLPWFYLPKLLLITIPAYILFFFFYATIWTITIKLNYRKSKNTSELDVYDFTKFLMTLLIVPIIGVLLLRPSIYDAWRHFLFLSVLIVPIASVGFWLLMNKSFNLRLVAFSIAIIGILTTASRMISLHPYEYIYFNQIGGGLVSAQGKYETEYWGKTFKEESDWINNNNDKLGNIPVLSCVPHLSFVYLDKNIKIASDNKITPYLYVCFTRLGKNEIYGGKVLHQIIRDGVVISEIRLIN